MVSLAVKVVASPGGKAASSPVVKVAVRAADSPVVKVAASPVVKVVANPEAARRAVVCPEVVCRAVQKVPAVPQVDHPTVAVKSAVFLVVVVVTKVCHRRRVSEAPAVAPMAALPVLAQKQVDPLAARAAPTAIRMVTPMDSPVVIAVIPAHCPVESVVWARPVNAWVAAVHRHRIQKKWPPVAPMVVADPVAAVLLKATVRLAAAVAPLMAA